MTRHPPSLPHRGDARPALGGGGAVQLRADGAHVSLAGEGQLRYKEQVVNTEH